MSLCTGVVRREGVGLITGVIIKLRTAWAYKRGHIHGRDYIRRFMVIRKTKM